MPADGDPSIYLSFDDGPHPIATPFVLRQLEDYDAKGTFFCIGKNVAEYPEIFQAIQAAGHSIGNHTHNHLNGWKTTTKEYLDNYDLASNLISSRAFRPPYGRITRAQAKEIQTNPRAGKIFMWSVLSGDFDKTLSPEKCLKNTLNNIQPGSIIVFHDSTKAWKRLEFCLPRIMDFCKNNDWKFKGLI